MAVSAAVLQEPGPGHDGSVRIGTRPHLKVGGRYCMDEGEIEGT